DVLSGGGGADLFVGGAGVDTFQFGSGDRIVDQAANEQVDLELNRALNQTPTPDQLRQTGQLTVSLVTVGTMGNYVTITGPSGYGFQLSGGWNATQNSNGSETFTSSSATLKTAVGDIPLGSVTLTAGADSVPDSGPLISPADGIFNAVTLLTNNPIIAGINDLTGIEFASDQPGNQGLKFGVKLGSALMASELSGFGAPLNNAIPYLYASFNIGNNLFTFGDTNKVSVSSSQNARVAFVFDPADPFFWLKGEINNIGGSIGFSSHGNIPFIPNKMPDIVPSSKQIYGNIVGSIKVPFEKVIRLEGQLVLDYDRNSGPGNYSSSLSSPVDSNEFASLFKDGSPDLEVIIGALANTELGINGSIEFTPEIGNTGLGLTLPIGSGTAMFYGGNTIAFSGGTDNPFSTIPLLSTLGLNPGTSIQSQGYYNIDTGNFRIDVEAQKGNTKFGPFSTTGDLKFVIDNDGVALDFGIDTPVASARFSGRAAFEDTTITVANYYGGTTTLITKAGTFSLEARLSPVDLDFEVASVKASLTIKITNQVVSFSGTLTDPVYTYSPGAVQLGLVMSLTLRSPILDVDLSADVNFTLGGSTLQFSGTLRGTIAFGFGPVSVEFGISNAGIRVEIPFLGVNVNVPIPGLLHVDQSAFGNQLLDESLINAVALPGIVDEAIRRLERTGLSNDEVALLKTVAFRVKDIDDQYQTVGYASGRIVTLDANAAGHGWFIDSSPEDDVEFDPITGLARSNSTSSGRIDLLSAVMHEMTHVLEFANPDREFDFGEVGAELIAVGQRFDVGISTSLKSRRD
ncbi:MAG: hypothetical protein HQ518_06675, partial [Rhodopirellula sp.]|nr:hypothetical protein [Rhodopirellula sp.]